MARLAARHRCSLDLIQWQTGPGPVGRWTWATTSGPAGETVVVPEVDKWRLPNLWRPLAERLQAHHTADTTTEDRLTVMINSLVVN